MIDDRSCPKAYHVECTGRESEFFEKRGQWFCGNIAYLVVYLVVSFLSSIGKFMFVYICFCCLLIYGWKVSGWHVCSLCSRSAKLNCYLCPSALCSTCMKGANFLCIRKSRGLCEGCYPLVHMIEHNETINGETVSSSMLLDALHKAIHILFQTGISHFSWFVESLC